MGTSYARSYTEGEGECCVKDMDTLSCSPVLSNLENISSGLVSSTMEAHSLGWSSQHRRAAGKR